MSWRHFGERKTTALSAGSALDFGKYKGSIIERILELDPQYLWWCIENVEGFSERLEDGLEGRIAEAAQDDDPYLYDREW